LLKNNYQVFPVDDRGIDFLGYRFFHDFILLRKSIALNFKTKIRNIRKHWQVMIGSNAINGLMSYYGWIKHGNCSRLFHKYVDEEVKEIIAFNCKRLKQKNPLMEVTI